jgi:hypothetical protein
METEQLRQAAEVAVLQLRENLREIAALNGFFPTKQLEDIAELEAIDEVRDLSGLCTTRVVVVPEEGVDAERAGDGADDADEALGEPSELERARLEVAAKEAGAADGPLELGLHLVELLLSEHGAALDLSDEVRAVDRRRTASGAVIAPEEGVNAKRACNGADDADDALGKTTELERTRIEVTAENAAAAHGLLELGLHLVELLLGEQTATLDLGDQVLCVHRRRAASGGVVSAEERRDAGEEAPDGGRAGRALEKRPKEARGSGALVERQLTASGGIVVAAEQGRDASKEARDGRRASRALEKRLEKGCGAGALVEVTTALPEPMI